jgi:hypothetical protein
MLTAAASGLAAGGSSGMTRRSRAGPDAARPIAVRACDPELGPAKPANAPQNLSPRSDARDSATPNDLFCSDFRCSRPRPPRRAPPYQGGARRSRSEADLQGVLVHLADSTRQPSLTKRDSVITKKGRFCRYLSSLPDPNRGPPPYYGGSICFYMMCERRLLARFPRIRSVCPL